MFLYNVSIAILDPCVRYYATQGESVVKKQEYWQNRSNKY